MSTPSPTSQRDAAAQRFLIVGGSGLLGSELMTTLREQGYAVEGTSRSANRPGLRRFDLQDDRIADCVAEDFFGGASVVAVVCAGVFQLDRCRRERATTRLINVAYTCRLVHDLAEVGAYPIFLSSSYVFDGQTGHYREDAPPAPICEYGRQKRAAEIQIRDEVPHALILRLDKLVSERAGAKDLFDQWIGNVQNGHPLRCIRDQVFSPSATKDVAETILAAAQRQLAGVYHAANPESWSREELAREFVAACAPAHPVESVPQAAFGFDDPRPLRTHLDASRLLAATGQTFTPMREVIQRRVQAEGMVR